MGSKAYKHIKRKPYTIRIGMLIIVMIIGIMLLIYASYTKRARVEEEKFNSIVKQLTFMSENSATEKEELLKYFNNGFIGMESKGKAAYLLARYFEFEGNYEQSIQYACEAVFHLKKSDNLGRVADTYVEIATMCTNIGAYKSAIRMLNEVRNLNLPQQDKAQKYFYADVNYAQVYSIIGDTKKTDEYLEKVYKYLEKDNRYARYYSGIRLMEARNCYNKKEYLKALEILESVEIDGTYKDDIVLNNETLPYLEMISKVYIVLGRLEESNWYRSEYIRLCEENNRLYEKYRFISEIGTLFEEKEITGSIVDLYNKQLITGYPELIASQGEQAAELMYSMYKTALAHKYETEAKWRIEARVRRFVIEGTVLVMLINVLLLWVTIKAFTDSLVPLANRRLFDFCYTEVVKKKMKYSIIIFDIDNFKYCNDTYGHGFGDEVLIRIAQTAKRRAGCRNVFRYGGEEFCVVTSKSPKEKLIKLAEEIRMDIEQLTWEKEGLDKITVSMGLATRDESDDPLILADQRLYESKRTGKNKVTYN